MSIHRLSLRRMQAENFLLPNVLNHVLHDCRFSHAIDEGNIWTKVEKNGKRSDTYTVINSKNKTDITFKLDTYKWDNDFFFLTVKRAPEVGWSVYVHLLGSRDKCVNYEVDIEVRNTDEEMGDFVYKEKSEPYCLEMTDGEKSSGEVIIADKSFAKLLSPNDDDGKEVQFAVNMEFRKV